MFGAIARLPDGSIAWTPGRWEGAFELGEPNAETLNGSGTRWGARANLLRGRPINEHLADSPHIVPRIRMLMAT